MSPSAKTNIIIPIHFRAEDGGWKLGNYAEKHRKIGLNGRTLGGEAGILLPSASVSIHQLPRTPVDIRDMCGRKTEDGRWKIMRKNRENGPKRQKPGRCWRNIASVSFRQLPRTSVDIRDMCGRKTEDGRWEIMRKNREKWA